MIREVKIAILIPNFGRGGAEIFALEIASSLSENYNITFYCSEKIEKPYDHDKVNVKFIGSDLYNLERLITLLKKEKIDLIWSHISWDNSHLGKFPAFKKAGFKVILTEHSSFWYPFFVEGAGLVIGAKKLKLNAISNLGVIDAVVCVSQDTCDTYRKFINNAHYIPNYPNPTYTEPREKNNIRKNVPKVIGNVSSFHKRVKRIDLLYKVFDAVLKKTPNAELHIAGAIDVKADYRFRHVSTELSLSSKISLHGVIEDVKSFYEQIDLLCLTSQLEGMPTVILEAAAMGVPTVAFSIPGIQDIVQHEKTGYIVDFLDVEGMGNVIADLIQNESKLLELGRNARSFVLKQFSLHNSTTKYTELIQSIVQSNGVVTDFQSNYKTIKANLNYQKKELELTYLFKQVLRDEWPKSLPMDWNLTPLVSFLIPCFNCINTVLRAIYSFCNASNFDWECVIVDDGSDDASYQYIKEITGKNQRFRIIRHSTNLGLYQSRTTLAKNARGLYLIFLDSDDTIDVNKINSYLLKAITSDCDIVDSGLNEVLENGISKHYPPYSDFFPESEKLLPDESLSAYLTNKIKHSCCGKVYLKSAFMKTVEQNLPFEKINLCEDLIRNTIFFSSGVSYASIKGYPFYNYIRRNESMSKKYPSVSVLVKSMLELVKIYEYNRRHIAHHSSEYVVDKFKIRLYNDLGWVMNQFFENIKLKDKRLCLLELESNLPDMVKTIYETTTDKDYATEIEKQIDTKIFFFKTKKE